MRAGTRAGQLPNCATFGSELGVSRRTLMRDLDFLREEEKAPLAYDASTGGYKLTDVTYTGNDPGNLRAQGVDPLASLLDAGGQGPGPTRTPN